jgi:hypothetical protein
MLATIRGVGQAFDKLLEMANTGYMPIIKVVKRKLDTLKGHFEM